MLDFGFYNMDCMDGMREFPDQFFDLAICDPPYGINVGQSSMSAGGGVAPHRNRSAANLRGGSEQQICAPGGGNKTYIPFGGKKKQDDKQLRIEGGGTTSINRRFKAVRK